jgi:hypothetical protein
MAGRGVAWCGGARRVVALCSVSCCGVASRRVAGRGVAGRGAALRQTDKQGILTDSDWPQRAVINLHDPIMRDRAAKI